MIFKKIFIIAVFSLFCFQSYGQSFIEGLTKDENLVLLPYVNFYCKNTFLGMSNESGEFKILIHDSFKFDTFKCEYLGYNSFTKSINEFTDSEEHTIILNQSSIVLPEAIVRAKQQYSFGKIKLAGAFRNNPKGTYYMEVGSMVGMYIKNEISKEAFLKRAYFYVTQEGFPDTKFRVHIYEVDNTGMPVKELLDSNYYAQATHGGAEWVAIEFKTAQIKFPPNGIIIAMEWLPIAEGKITKKNIGSREITFKGQCLGGTWEFDQDLSLTYKNKWYKYEPPDGIKILKQLNPMIRVEFDVVK